MFDVSSILLKYFFIDEVAHLSWFLDMFFLSTIPAVIFHPRRESFYFFPSTFGCKYKFLKMTWALFGVLLCPTTSSVYLFGTSPGICEESFWC